jgi:hypothetical protein
MTYKEIVSPGRLVCHLQMHHSSTEKKIPPALKNSSLATMIIATLLQELCKIQRTSMGRKWIAASFSHSRLSSTKKIAPSCFQIVKYKIRARFCYYTARQGSWMKKHQTFAWEDAVKMWHSWQSFKQNRRIMKVMYNGVRTMQDT